MKYILNIVLIVFLLILNIVVLFLRAIVWVLRFLFRSLFWPFFPKPQEKSYEPGKVEVSHRDDGILSVNMDNLEQDEQKEFREAIAEETEFTVYEGYARHAYDLKAVSSTDRCPRCHSRTQQQYASFIYATQTEPRVIFVPAGYFCTRCPTVIIDQQLIRSGITRGFKYQGVLGIDYDDETKPIVFETWNGEKTFYIIDENENTVGMTSMPVPLHSQRSHKKSQKARQRKKIAKKSRKKNRRKK